MLVMNEDTFWLKGLILGLFVGVLPQLVDRFKNRLTISCWTLSKKTDPTPFTKMRITFCSGVGSTRDRWHWKLDPKGFLYSSCMIGFGIFM